jgi:hypothetical protein
MRRWSETPFIPPAAIILALAIAATGCGGSDGLPRQHVSGSVTLDSEPLSGAWIEFRPEGPSAVTASGATIEGGRYDISRTDGLVPGSYRVSITKAGPPEGAGAPPAGAPPASGQRPGTKKAAAPGPFGFAKQLIPARYNTKSELTAKVEEGQANAFDFTLNSK